MSNKKTTIFYFSGTHWDREWYQAFQGFRYRLVNAVNKIIEVLENDEAFRVFHLDGQTIILEDFLEIEPGKRYQLEKLIQEGRVAIGPWYVMPDEFLLSGESLIRNLMTGHSIAKKWGVEAWKFGYICDVFGHIAQMPQIFNGFDIHYALLGRGTNEYNVPAFFRWQSPDGSECTTYKFMDTNGYGSFCVDVLGFQNNRYKDISEISLKIKDYIDYEMARTSLPIVVVMDAMDHEEIHPETPQVIQMIQEIYPNADVRHENLVNMGEAASLYREQMPVKTGELNETAKNKVPFIHLITHTLSSRYPLKQENDLCQALLEKWVEPLTAIMSIRGCNMQKSYVELAYKYLMQNHPHDSICGCSIDQVHKDMEYRFDQSKMISRQLLDELMNFEAKRFDKDEKSHSKVLLLWNPLPYERKEVVSVNIDFHQDYRSRYQEPFGYEEINSFKIFDYNSREIPYKVSCIKNNQILRRYNQYNETVDLYSVTLHVEVPAMGTSEYRIIPFELPSRYLESMSLDERRVENEYIQLSINDNGTIDIVDKENGREYRQLISYLDDGEIGDGWFHVNPVEDTLISSIGTQCIIERIESGPCRTVFKVTNIMSVPCGIDYSVRGVRRGSRYIAMKITSIIGLSKGARYIDVETIVDNCAKDHRLRLKLPTGISRYEYFVNQPFAFVERKCGIRLKTQEWKECDVPEKQMGGIVGKRESSGTGIVFVSEGGLHECAAFDDEKGTITITLFRSFSKTVLTNGEEGGQIQGTLKFKYRLVLTSATTSYADMQKLQDCIQAGFGMITARTAEKILPSAPISYFEVSGEGVCMSIIKRPENGQKDRIIMRIYNISSKETTALIKCIWPIEKASLVNLNEEHIDYVDANENTVKVALGPWKIKTLSLKLTI